MRLHLTIFTDWKRSVLMSKLYAERVKGTNKYWNDKKGCFTTDVNNPDIWHTKEHLEKMRRFYSDVFQVNNDREYEIVEKEVE